jgi:hypothetical protein
MVAAAGSVSEIADLGDAALKVKAALARANIWRSSISNVSLTSVPAMIFLSSASISRRLDCVP